MAHQIGSASDGRPQKSPFERSLKAAVVLLFVLGGLYIVGSWLGSIIESTTQSRITGDLGTITKAIDRRRLKNPFLDNDLSLLQGDVLENVPRDPWGGAYYYDWFHERLVCIGPDQILTTRIPGMELGTSETHDDKVVELKALSNLAVVVDAPQSDQVVLIKQDGTDPIVLVDLPGADILGVAAHGKSPVVIATVKTARRHQVLAIELPADLESLRLVEGEIKPTVTTLYESEQTLGAPSLYSVNNDWVLFDAISSDKSGSPRSIMRVGHREPRPVALTPPALDAFSPSAEIQGRQIYFCRRQGGRAAAYRAPLNGLNNATPFLSDKNADLTHPTPSSRGDRLAVIEVRGRSAILRVLDGNRLGELHRVADVWPRSPVAFSPGDDKVVYFASRSGRPVLTMLHVVKKVTASLDFLEFTVKPVALAWVGP